MSELNEQPAQSELDMLKSRARLMGITFSNNISLETLRERVNAKMSGEPEVEAEPEAEEANGLEAAAAIADTRDTIPATNASETPAPARKLTAAEQKMKDRSDLIKEQMKLVRCRIQNLDPKKANLPGEIFTIGNRVLGTIRKFVPYGEVTEDGYHLPYIIYRALEDRRFLNIRTMKDRKTGHVRVESNWAKEFAIEVLPPLTQEELNKLATAQIAAGSVDAN